MDDITLRPAERHDLPQLAKLLEKLFTIEEDFQCSCDRQIRGLEMLLESKSGTIVVAEQNEIIVGMVTGQLTISTAEGGPSLLIEDLFVDEQAQGRGIGRLLLEKAGKWGKGFGANRMQLLADRCNQKALDFYTHIGWQRTQLICLRNYFSSGVK